MSINYSGTLSMGNATAGQSIRLEEGGPTTNISLRSLSSIAGKATPDAMSEFYGYTYSPKTFTGVKKIVSPTTSSVNTNQLVVTTATTVYCNAFGGASVGCTCTGTIIVGTSPGGSQIGSRSTSVVPQYGNLNSATLAVPVGTYYYQVTAVYGGPSSGQSAEIF